MVMSVDETLNRFMGEKQFAFGVDTAIKALRPGCHYDISVANGNYFFNKFYDPNGLAAPTKEEIEEEMEFQKKLFEFYDYKAKRFGEYPNIYDQLDTLWHSFNELGDSNPLKNSDWFKSIKQTKEKYPKTQGIAPTRK